MLRSNPNTGPAGHRRADPSERPVLLFAGSAPESIRLAPLRDALNHCGRPYRPVLVYAGQSHDDSMYADLVDRLTIFNPDICLGIGQESPGLQAGMTLMAVEQLIHDQEPHMVVVSGESDSAMAAAISAAQLKVPVAHVGAGLRSHDLSVPDEIERVVTDSISTLFFTTCEDANINLLREGVAEEAIHFVGNILVDSLCRILPETDELHILNDLGIEPGKYTVVALDQFRHDNDPKWLQKVVTILDELASLGPVVLATPPFSREGLRQRDEDGGIHAVVRNPRIRMPASWSFLEVLKLMKESAAVITDLSEVQEYTTFLGVQCLTIASGTSQQVTVTDGTNSLTGLNPSRAVGFARLYLGGDLPKVRRPLLWDGSTADRIVKAISGFFREAQEPYSQDAQPLDDVEVQKAGNPAPGSR